MEFEQRVLAVEIIYFLQGEFVTPGESEARGEAIDGSTRNQSSSNAVNKKRETGD
jgi:hypothetical protein